MPVVSNIISAGSLLVLGISLAVGISASLGQAQAAALYKWVDENGQVRYSDRLPPNQVKKKHQQLNSQGVVLSTTEDAKTDEQRALEAEEKRKAAEQKAKDDIINAAQNKKDNVLLMTFSNEGELGLARDNRLEVLESVIQLINKSIAATVETLQILEESAEKNYISQGKEVPGGLAQKIEHFTRKIESRNAQLNLKQKEMDKINEQYETDLARYRLLKSETN